MSGQTKVNDAQLAYICDNPESASPDEVSLMAGELKSLRSSRSVSHGDIFPVYDGHTAQQLLLRAVYLDKIGPVGGSVHLIR